MQWTYDSNDDDLVSVDASVLANRRPTTPGEILRREILEQHSLTQDDLASAMGVSRYSVNQLVNEKRNLTAEMAIRLGKATGTSPEFWLNLQRAVELFDARVELSGKLDDVRVVVQPQAEDAYLDDDSH